jgi:hypothetical protein
VAGSTQKIIELTAEVGLSDCGVNRMGPPEGGAKLSSLGRYRKPLPVVPRNLDRWKPAFEQLDGYFELVSSESARHRW